MAHVVTVTNRATKAIVTRTVFQYPETAKAVAEVASDYAESLRLTAGPEAEQEVTCEQDSYSCVDDNELSIEDALKIRLSRLADDRQEARKIRL